MAIDSRQLVTVAQFVEERKGFTESAIRWQIFNAHSNGLAESGAIVRVPGSNRILINVPKYDGWIENGASK